MLPSELNFMTRVWPCTHGVVHNARSVSAELVNLITDTTISDAACTHIYSNGNDWSLVLDFLYVMLTTPTQSPFLMTGTLTP